MAFPNPPEKIVPFNSGPVAAHDIGRQFDEHRRGFAELIDFLKNVIRSDGVVRKEAMPAPPARVQGGSKESTLPVGVLGPNAGGFYAGDDAGATATSADYAQVCIAWAEHMPDTIPPNILAINAITGDHWSARWWANRAAFLASLAPAAAGVLIGDNRIINGDMRIDQRFGGALGQATGYCIDRWKYGATQANKLQFKVNLNNLIPAPGFPCYLGFQNIGTAYPVLSTDDFIIMQFVEADAVGDLGWGTVNALPVTLSFWAQCSGITGTFSGSIRNSAQNRSYPFSFALPTALAWVQFAITIPGDTAGAWLTSGNGVGLCLTFNFGAGSAALGPANAWANANTIGVTGSANILPNASAALYLTGVKLEVGNVATPFNHPSLARSMADCQRYYVALGNVQMAAYQAAGVNMMQTIVWPTTMRAAPTVNFVSPSYSNASGITTTNLNALGTSIYAVATALGSTVWTAGVQANAEL